MKCGDYTVLGCCQINSPAGKQGFGLIQQTEKRRKAALMNPWQWIMTVSKERLKEGERDFYTCKHVQRAGVCSGYLSKEAVVTWDTFYYLINSVFNQISFIWAKNKSHCFKNVQLNLSPPSSLSLITAPPQTEHLCHKHKHTVACPRARVCVCVCFRDQTKHSVRSSSHFPKTLPVWWWSFIRKCL